MRRELLRPRRQQSEQTLVRQRRLADGLDADMVRTGAPVLVDAGTDRLFVAPDYHGVDQPIGSAAGKVRVAETQPPPVVDVIGQAQI